MRKFHILLIVLCAMTLTNCKTSRFHGENPFFFEWDTPYGIPPFDEIKPEHYKPAMEKAMELHKAEIDSIVANPAAPDFRNTILAFDNSGKKLDQVTSVFDMVTAADTNEELQAVRKEMIPLLSKHSDEITLNDRLFDRVHAVYDGLGTPGLDKGPDNNLDSLQRRLTEKIHKGFVRSGALLDAAQKERLKAINGELASAQVRFGDNMLKALADFKMVLDSADVKGLPAAVKDAAAAAAEKAGEKGRFLFTLDKSSMIPFLINSDREDLRDSLYRGYLDRCNYGTPTDNREVINEIVRLRMERAQLLGFDSHAQYVLDDRMAKTPDNVYGLLDQLWSPALERAKEEASEFGARKNADNPGRPLMASDWWFYAEKVRKQRYDLDEEMIKPYFSLSNVQAGIFELCNRLYGITFRPLKNVPVYNAECTSYEVFDKDGSHLGVLIMDFFPRPGKGSGAWCVTYRMRSYENGQRIDPIVSIVANFTRPSGSRPALLNIEETSTFFHEFGHAVHMMMIDVPYLGLTDGVERDFIELPSQLMENWALRPEMLRRYATHYSTGDVIPDNLIEKIGAAATFNQGFATTELLAASYSDMDIHMLAQYSPIDVNAFETEALNVRRGLIPEIAPRYRYPYFGHIFDGGYSAGYYGYIWAEVLDKDAFEAFVESGDIFDTKVAESFRKNILERGSSADGMTLYRNFRGHEPSGEYLLYSRGLKERPEPVREERLKEVVYIQDENGDIIGSRVVGDTTGFSEAGLGGISPDELGDLMR